MNGGDITPWLRRIEEKVDGLTTTAFTKQDMESFKRDICAPSREEQCKIKDCVRKVELKSSSFQARVGGIVAAAIFIWGVIAFFIVNFKGH